MENPKVILSQAEFDRYEVCYPSNMVIIQMPPEHKILTKTGIDVGFNPDVNYATQNDDDKSAHVADCAAVYGKVVKQPERLYFNRKDVKHTMSYECDLETEIDDLVWTHPLAAKNCAEIIVGETIYKVLPYEDLFVAKRTIWLDKWTGKKQNIIIPLNGNVILQTVNKPSLSDLDVLEKELDPERGIVKWNGKNNKSYQYPGVADIEGLKDGDLVMIQKGCYPFFLERSKYNANFDGDNQYFVVQKRHIMCVL